MRIPRILGVILSIELALAHVAPARADNKAMAEQLFQDAKQLMEAGHANEACPKLEESNRLDPADGTQLRLSMCYQAVGKWASAWAGYREAIVRAQKAGRKDRIDLASKGLSEVEAKLSHVAIQVPPETKVAGLEVRWDGQVIGSGGWGTSMPVDPGPHTLLASAPGYRKWGTTITIAATAEDRTASIPKLEPEPTPVPSKPEPKAASQASGPQQDKPHASGDAEGSRSAALSYIAFGAGALFLGGAIGARVVALHARDEHAATCSEQHTLGCDDDAGRSKVRTWETLSWVSGGIALAAVGAGVVLFVTRAHKGEQGAVITASPAITGGGAGLSLQATF